MRIITDKLIKGYIPKCTYTKKISNSVMVTKHVYDLNETVEEFLKLHEEGSNESK